MKTIAKTFVLILITANLFAQTTYNYTDIFFLDENHGWLLGTNSNLWKTTNTGITWEHIYNNDVNGGTGIQFTSPTTGWLTKHSELFITTDGGDTWQIVFTNPYNVNPSDSYFINDSIGFVSSDSALFRTLDAGTNWNLLTDTLGNSISPYFYNENSGFITFINRENWGIVHVYKTTDLGNTWTLSNECGSINGCSFGKIQMHTDNEGIMSELYIDVVPIDRIIKTTDGGNFWNTFPSPSILFGLSDFEFITIEQGWITTNSNQIFRTTNQGVNWDTLQSSLTLNEVIKNIEFFNSNISYGISSNHIYFTDDGWVTYSIVDSIVTNVENQQSEPTQFILHQNYPNPFNPTTVISYQLPINGNVTLKVYDLLGREVSTLVDEYQPAGKFEVEFISAELSAGIYFYQLSAKDFTITRKMLLLK